MLIVEADVNVRPISNRSRGTINGDELEGVGYVIAEGVEERETREEGC